MDTVNFVSLVEQSHALWDKGHKDYKNSDVKDKLWIDIGQVFGISGEEARSLFKSIRLKYVRRKTEIKNNARRGLAAKPLKPWALHEHLKFLDDTIIPRRTISSILNAHTSIKQSPSCKQETSEDQRDQSTDDVEDYYSMSVSEESVCVMASPPAADAHSECSTPVSEPQPSSSKLVKPMLRKKNHEDCEDKITSGNSASVDKWGVSEEVKHFCKFIGNRLNELPKKKLRKAESLILRVITDIDDE